MLYLWKDLSRKKGKQEILNFVSEMIMRNCYVWIFDLLKDGTCCGCFRRMNDEPDYQGG